MTGLLPIKHHECRRVFWMTVSSDGSGRALSAYNVRRSIDDRCLLGCNPEQWLNYSNHNTCATMCYPNLFSTFCQYPSLFLIVMT